MPTETSIVNSIKRMFKRRYRGVIRKLHGSKYSIEGDPDLYGCAVLPVACPKCGEVFDVGRSFAIEVKRPGETARKIQEARIREWGSGGAIAGVAHSKEEAADILDGVSDWKDLL